MHEQYRRVSARLRSGGVFPAHPLALSEPGQVDWRAQRALSRYYLDAGAHGLAVGVHTTQFALHDDRALLGDVLRRAADVVRGTDALLIAGVTGDCAQAIREAELARDLGYDAVLLATRGMDRHATEKALLERSIAVGEIMPTIAFYMQEKVGGRYLTPQYWRAVFEQTSTVGVKVAPFDRYRTGDVARALLESDRWNEIAFLTGNDDTIVLDLITPYRRAVAGTARVVRARGGLLGQWAVGTRAAVQLCTRLNSTDPVRDPVRTDELRLGGELVEINSAVFDVDNDFRGSVAGINELLRQQGLLRSAHCLDEGDVLSAGQSHRIARVRRLHPELLDEEYVAEHRERWLED